MKNILVVDDSDALRESIHYILESHGYHVDDAASENEGLLKLAHASYDAVIADEHQPEIEGMRLAARIHRIPGCDRIPILRLIDSTDMDLASLEKRKAEDGDPVIVKPFSSDRLISEVKKICGEDPAA